VRKLEPNMQIVECFDRETNTCKVVSACRLKHFLQNANQAFLDVLNEHSLAEAVKDQALFLNRPRPK
jgi:Rrf2 family nitric oxide-sensitive transcriptional repressor